MSRSYVTFDDIAGQLDSLNIECGRCPRKGRYHVDKLIEKYGRMGNLSQWLSDLSGACPKRNAFLLQDRCDVRCPAAHGAASLGASLDGLLHLTDAHLPRALAQTNSICERSANRTRCHCCNCQSQIRTIGEPLKVADPRWIRHGHSDRRP